MKKVRRFNGEEGSEVSDETLNQLRQKQTERMARLARGESGDAPAASVSRSMVPAAEPAEAPAEPAEAPAAPAEAPAAPAEAPAAPKAKPPIVTLQQLNAFKAKYGADKELRDYMNHQAGGLKRRNAPSPSTPSSSGGSGGRGGPTAEQFDDDQDEKEYRKVQAEVDLHNSKLKAYKKAQEAAQTPEGKAKRSAMEKSQALEGSYPVENLAGGAAGLLKAGAGKLFGREAAEEFVKRGEPIYREPKLEILKDIPKLLGGPKKQMALPAPPKQLALPAPPRRLPYDRPAASAAESTTAKLAGELRRGAQPTKFTSPNKSTASKKTRKFNEDEGGVEFRRGGSVSSASKRADGCAIRGKTRA